MYIVYVYSIYVYSIYVYSIYVYILLYIYIIIYILLYIYIYIIIYILLYIYIYYYIYIYIIIIYIYIYYYYYLYIYIYIHIYIYTTIFWAICILLPTTSHYYPLLLSLLPLLPATTTITDTAYFRPRYHRRGNNLGHRTHTTPYYIVPPRPCFYY